MLGLRALGHRAALAAHPDAALFARMSEGLDLIPLAPRYEVDLTAAWRLSRIIRELRPRIVHAHDPHGVSMAAMALAISTPSPKPLLVVSRRIEFRVARNSFSRWKYAQADCIIAISAAVRDRLAADGIPPVKIQVVHEGVDVDRIQRLPAANVHAEFYLPTQAPVVGNVGALVPQKGQHHLIDAAALVVREVPDTRFVVLGDGELRESLEQHIRRGHLERHVLLGGFRPNVLELVKGFDVFALSSIHEGMCTSLVDAMAAARPAVASAVGGVPEVVADGETGFLVPPRDPRAMAQKVVLLLRNEQLRARMGAAALARARERFTAERMVEQTIAIYAELIRAADARPAPSRP